MKKNSVVCNKYIFLSNILRRNPTKKSFNCKYIHSYFCDGEKKIYFQSLLSMLFFLSVFLYFYFQSISLFPYIRELDFVRTISYNCQLHQEQQLPMSNTREFLIPINYDITQPVYKPDEIVRKRQYLINSLNSIKRYHQMLKNTSSDPEFQSKCYADKLQHQVKN